MPPIAAHLKRLAVHQARFIPFTLYSGLSASVLLQTMLSATSEKASYPAHLLACRFQPLSFAGGYRAG